MVGSAAPPLMLILLACSRIVVPRAPDLVRMPMRQGLRPSMSEISAHQNSVQSRLSSIFTDPDSPQPFDAGDSLLERHRGHVMSVELGGFPEATCYSPRGDLVHDSAP